MTDATEEEQLRRITCRALYGSPWPGDREEGRSAVTKVSFEGALIEALVGFVRDHQDELLEMQQPVHAKERVYGNSTFRRGAEGLYHNCARKWDRIEILQGLSLAAQQVRVDQEAVVDQERAPETLYKTVRDLAVYAIQWLRVMKELPFARMERT